MMKNFKLSRELRQAGATRQEVSDLAALTVDLKAALPHLGESVKRQIAQDIGLHRRPVYTRPKFALAGAFVALIVLSVLAQFAQPGSPLYALKRATDEVRVILQPSIKAELEHQRQAEQRKADDQQRIENSPSNRVDSKSGDASSSDGTSGSSGGTSGGVSDGGSGSSSKTGSSDGSGKGADIKVDSSGPGTGNITTPAPSSSGGGQSGDGGGSGGGRTSDGGSGDGLKL